MFQAGNLEIEIPSDRVPIHLKQQILAQRQRTIRPIQPLTQGALDQHRTLGWRRLGNGGRRQHPTHRSHWRRRQQLGLTRTADRRRHRRRRRRLDHQPLDTNRLTPWLDRRMRSRPLAQSQQQGRMQRHNQNQCRAIPWLCRAPISHTVDRCPPDARPRPRGQPAQRRSCPPQPRPWAHRARPPIQHAPHPAHRRSSSGE